MLAGLTNLKQDGLVGRRFFIVEAAPLETVPLLDCLLYMYMYVYLTNRFHVAVRLFSNRSQMTSKCGKNKKVAHEAIAECVTDVLTTF